MLEDPAAPGIPPLALLCTTVPQAPLFVENLKDQYSYEVLGGLHTVTARKELLDEMPGKYTWYICITTVTVTV